MTRSACRRDSPWRAVGRADTSATTPRSHRDYSAEACCATAARSTCAPSARTTAGAWSPLRAARAAIPVLPVS